MKHITVKLCKQLKASGCQRYYAMLLIKVPS